MVDEKRLIIVSMALVTYIPRVVPLQVNSKYWPKWMKISLEFLPVAIVASITIPNILINNYTGYFLTSEFLSTIFAIIVASYSKNLIVTVLTSLLFFFVVNNYLLFS